MVSVILNTTTHKDVSYHRQQNISCENSLCWKIKCAHTLSKILYFLLLVQARKLKTRIVHLSTQRDMKRVVSHKIKCSKICNSVCIRSLAFAVEIWRWFLILQLKVYIQCCTQPLTVLVLPNIVYNVFTCTFVVISFSTAQWWIEARNVFMGFHSIKIEYIQNFSRPCPLQYQCVCNDSRSRCQKVVLPKSWKIHLLVRKRLTEGLCSRTMGSGRLPGSLECPHPALPVCLLLSLHLCTFPDTQQEQ